MHLRFRQEPSRGARARGASVSVSVGGSGECSRCERGRRGHGTRCGGWCDGCTGGREERVEVERATQVAVNAPPGAAERGPTQRAAAAWQGTQAGAVPPGCAHDANGGADGHDREHRAAGVPSPTEGEAGPEKLTRWPLEGRAQLALVDDPQYGLGRVDRQGAFTGSGRLKERVY